MEGQACRHAYNLPSLPATPPRLPPAPPSTRPTNLVGPVLYKVWHKAKVGEGSRPRVGQLARPRLHPSQGVQVQAEITFLNERITQDLI